MASNWSHIEQKALKNESLSFEEALSIVACPDADLMELVASARRVRETFFGTVVKLNYLVNIKSGLCSEDCRYCSQSKLSKAPIEKYPLMKAEEIIANVDRGREMGAARACLVSSGRAPSDREVAEVSRAAETLKTRHSGMEVCVCLGLLKEGQPGQLKKAGVDAYNHNINTSEKHYSDICETHTYKDRLDTMRKAKDGGLDLCSGVLTGMGESDKDLVMMAFTLREKMADSIPVNFLMAIENTPLAGMNQLTPQKCLKILALFRMVNPTIELRMAGGREVHLRSLQAVGLMIANSMFIGDYLTTTGQSPKADLAMIHDLGYTVKGQPPDFLPRLLGTSKPQLKSPEREHSVA